MSSTSSKNVHFQHGYGTPSPSSTISSLPSSKGPHTPLHASPLAPLPLVQGPFYINPALVPQHGHTPIIDYDVSFRPETAALRDPKYADWYTLLGQAASNPPLQYLDITVEGLQWPLRIVPAGRGGFVTVHDVLNGIYTNLRTAVTGPEFARAQALGRGDNITRAFHGRVSRATKEAGANEYAKGLKRVDFLEGRTKLAGLTPTMQQNVWSMTLR